MRNTKTIQRTNVFAIILIVILLVEVLAYLFINKYVYTLIYSETIFAIESIILLFIIMHLNVFKKINADPINDNTLKYFINIILLIVALELLVFLVFNNIVFTNIIYSKFMAYSLLLGVMIFWIFKNKGRERKVGEYLKGILKATLYQAFKAFIMIFIVIAWLNSMFVCIINIFIEADINHTDEMSGMKITTIYEHDQLLDMCSIVRDDRDNILQMDINLLNDEYEIQALKYSHGRYFAMYKESEKALILIFSNIGKYEGHMFIDIKGDSQSVDKISFLDTPEDVGKYYAIGNEVLSEIQSSAHYESWYYTEDGYLVSVKYLFGKVSSINKCIF